MGYRVHFNGGYGFASALRKGYGFARNTCPHFFVKLSAYAKDALCKCSGYAIARLEYAFTAS